MNLIETNKEKIISKIKDLVNSQKENHRHFQQGFFTGSTLSHIIYNIIYPDHQIPKGNDIDIFILKDSNLPEEYMPSLENLNTSNMSIAKAPSNYFYELEIYSIENTLYFDDNNINITVIQEQSVNKKLEWNWINFLETFDLNCVQVGFDLKSETLYYTKEFLNFITSKIIEVAPLERINNLNNFFHIDKNHTSNNVLNHFLINIVRIEKKNREFNNSAMKAIENNIEMIFKYITFYKLLNKDIIEIKEGNNIGDKNLALIKNSNTLKDLLEYKGDNGKIFLKEKSLRKIKELENKDKFLFLTEILNPSIEKSILENFKINFNINEFFPILYIKDLDLIKIKELKNAINTKKNISTDLLWHLIKRFNTDLLEFSTVLKIINLEENQLNILRNVLGVDYCDIKDSIIKKQEYYCKEFLLDQKNNIKIHNHLGINNKILNFNKDILKIYKFLLFLTDSKKSFLSYKDALKNYNKSIFIEALIN